MSDNELRISLVDAVTIVAVRWECSRRERKGHRLVGNESFALDLLSFFADRLKVQLREQGARHDLVDAVFALGGQDDLLMVVRRVEALGKFLDTDDGKNLLAGTKRASNILAIEEKRDKRTFEGAPNPALYSLAEEKALADAIDLAKVEASVAVMNEDFASAMGAMAKLRPAVDAFFDKVKVNDDDPKVRENRLKLLNEIRAATRAVADFSGSRVEDWIARRSRPTTGTPQRLRKTGTNSRHRRDLHEIVKRFFIAGGVTADIGCGSGREVAWLNANGFPAKGFDASLGLLAEARRRYPPLDFVRAELPDLHVIVANSYDNVLCETVIMHLDRANIAPSVRRMLEIVKPGGILYVSWRVTEGEN